MTESTRLYVEDDLASGANVALGPERAHFLAHVLRLKAGEFVAVFNGRDGEWRGRIATLGKKDAQLIVESQRRPQAVEPDIWLVFAPIKHARLDYLVEKAAELGASALWPVFTRHTAVSRINTDRLRANAIEGAEQCERLSVPQVFEPAPLDKVMGNWPAGRRLLVLDERGDAPTLADTLAARPDAGSNAWAILVGPEGGFAGYELDLLRNLPFATPAGLGPRILRADTAALAALAVWQALQGDWRDRPARA